MSAITEPKHIVITGGAWHHETFGGAYKVATEFAEYLATQGHRVSYIAWSNDCSIAENPSDENGVEIWRYPAPKAKSPSLANACSHVMQTFRIVSLIASRHSIDYLNGHDPLQFLGAAFSVRNTSVTTSFSVHSPLVMEYKAQWGLLDRESAESMNLRQSLALSVLRWIETMTYRSAQIIQTDSRYTLGILHRDYPTVMKCKGVAAPLWVDLDRFSFCQDKSIPRKRLRHEWQSGCPVFFTVRRLVPRMGLDNLIRAVHLLAGDGIDCRLVIGGSGPEEDALLDLIKQLGIDDRVFMVGKISDEELPLFFQAADCFVLPTKTLECFGLIILEAYACGTPVIGTPIGSIPEVMGDLNADFVTDDSGVEAIYAKIKEFINGQLLVEPERLRRYAESFSYETMAQNLYGVVTGATTPS